MPKKEKNRPRGDRKAGTAEPLIQGEGDYISGRKYQNDAHRFAREQDTERLARAAAPRSETERREMAEAEKKGKARAKKSARR